MPIAHLLALKFRENQIIWPNHAEKDEVLAQIALVQGLAKSLYVVGRNFFLLSLNFSAWVLLSKICIFFSRSLYSIVLLKSPMKLPNSLCRRPFNPC